MKLITPKDIKPGFYWASIKPDAKKQKELQCELILKVSGESPFLKYQIWNHERDMLPDLDINKLTFIYAFK